MNEVEEWLNEYGSIIVASSLADQVGNIIKISEGVQPGTLRHIDHPFLVVRQATEQEYKAQCREILRRAGSKRELVSGNSSYKYFYEVRTD